MISCTERRVFLATAVATLSVVTTQASQTPDVPTVWADVPPGATLWGLFVFTGAEPIEMTVAAGKMIKSIRGAGLAGSA